MVDGGDFTEGAGESIVGGGDEIEGGGGVFAEGRGDLFTNGGDESSTIGVDGELTGVVCEWDDCGGMFSAFGGVCVDDGNGVGVSGNDPAGGGGERNRSTGDLS